ncbi:MAG: septal ring lytic transglycosylase RlpA family protein [Devosia sp.]
MTGCLSFVTGEVVAANNQCGTASWYGPGFNGKKSASGEKFNQNAMTAAHKSLPFGTVVKVVNQKTGKSVQVRINDRGPYVGGRVIDLSKAAATKLGMMQSGTAKVCLTEV